MIRQEINTKNANFIGCWKIENQKLFSSMIDFFEKNNHLQSKGVTGFGQDEKSKKTTNINIDPLFLKKEKFNFFNDYFGELYKCYNDYRQQWPALTFPSLPTKGGFLNTCSSNIINSKSEWLITGAFSILLLLR